MTATKPLARRAATGPVKDRAGRRSWATISVALLAAAVMAVVVVGLVLTAGHRTAVVKVLRPVAKGQSIGPGDLGQVSVAGLPGAIPWVEQSRLIGQTATVDLLAGQVVTSGMLTKQPVPGPGRSLVGLSLGPARAPLVGLTAGDVVNVIQVASTVAGTSGAAAQVQVLSQGAEVLEVQGKPAQGGAVLVTLLVKDTEAAAIAAAAATDRVAVVQTGSGPGR